MTDRSRKLSLARQADLLGISQGSLYYEPRPTSQVDLKLMRRIDELHMEYTFAIIRMMKDLLRQEGFTPGRLHIANCIRRMGELALPSCLGSTTILLVHDDETCFSAPPQGLSVPT